MKINLKKSVLEPVQEVAHLGFVLNFQEGSLQVTPTKLKTVKKELGKLVTKSHISCRKMAAILGTVRSFFSGSTFPPSLHRHHGWICKSTTKLGLGFPRHDSRKPKMPNKRGKGIVVQLDGSTLSKSREGSKGASLPFVHPRLGWVGPENRTICPRFLEGKSVPPHK